MPCFKGLGSDEARGRPKPYFQGKVQGKENLVRSNLQDILEKLLGKSIGKKQANMRGNGINLPCLG
jgi:hypothetical protein